MIITLSGMPGSGKSTVAKILSKKLRMSRYYMGGIRREMARKMGLTIDELNKLGERDPSSDAMQRRSINKFFVLKNEMSGAAEGSDAPMQIITSRDFRPFSLLSICNLAR